MAAEGRKARATHERGDAEFNGVPGGIRNLLCRAVLPGTHQYTIVAIEIAVHGLREVVWKCTNVAYPRV